MSDFSTILNHLVEYAICIDLIIIYSGAKNEIVAKSRRIEYTNTIKQDNSPVFFGISLK